jgi:hypothetical protein
MSTVLKAGKRRCDAVCHDAKGTECGCICGGRYHGSNVQPSKAAAQEEVKQLLRDKAIKQVEESFARAEQQPAFDFYGDQLPS